MTDWALAVTVPNSERAVSSEMARLSFPHVLFMARRVCVVRGRVVNRLTLAFPGYIFIQFNDRQRVCEIERVNFIAPKNGMAELVPERVVDDLVRRCEGGNVIPISEAPARFKYGDSVAIGGCGPASGHRGIYQWTNGVGRACVLFDWMGQFCPVDVDERDLDEIGQTNPARQKRNRRRRGRRRFPLSARRVRAA